VRPAKYNPIVNANNITNIYTHVQFIITALAVRLFFPMRIFFNPFTTNYYIYINFFIKLYGHKKIAAKSLQFFIDVFIPAFQKARLPVKDKRLYHA